MRMLVSLTTWQAPAEPPAKTSCGHQIFCVVLSVKCPRTRSLTVSLMAFSGATPISCGTTPEYKPSTPSLAITLRAHSIEFLYSTCPTRAERWFCMRVLTRSIGYTMKAPNAPAMLPSPKWCADSSTLCRNCLPREAACSTDSAAVAPNLYALCHDASSTLEKSVRARRPEGASMPAKWKRMSASMGVKREKRVRRAASLRKSVRVILPSALFCTAFWIIRSTRSISRMMFWKARTLAYEIRLPALMLHSVCRLSSRWSESLCCAVSRMMRWKSSGWM